MTGVPARGWAARVRGQGSHFDEDGTMEVASRRVED